MLRAYSMLGTVLITYIDNPLNLHTNSVRIIICTKYWDRNKHYIRNSKYTMPIWISIVQINDYLNHSLCSWGKKLYRISEGFFKHMEMLITPCCITLNIWSCSFQNKWSNNWADILFYFVVYRKRHFNFTIFSVLFCHLLTKL